MAYQQERESIRAGQLILRELNGELSVSERAELQRWLDKSSENRRTYANIQSGELRSEELEGLRNYDSTESLQNLLPRLARKPKSRSSKIYVGLAAALLVSISVAIGFYFRNQHTDQKSMLTSKYGGDVLPGDNRATLILSDGRKIDLEAASSGKVAEEIGVAIAKTGDGQLTYVGNEMQDIPSILYNEIHTPRGGQHSIILPDGTKVWLNAASSLRYPVRFEGTERRVVLTGEGYFEVTHNSGQPFIVEVKGTVIKDLGTEFNISAYPDEQHVETALVKGLASVRSGRQQVMLQPGRKAVAQDGKIAVSSADIEVITAWKNGLFIFHSEPVPALMAQVSRWYDITVEYAPGFQPHTRFTGEIRRDLPLSRLLTMIEMTGVASFSIKERTVIVGRFEERD